MKQKVKRIVFFLLPLVCVLAGCVRANTLKWLEVRYEIDINLLYDYEILCDVKGDTFTGRAPRYTVVGLTAEPTAFLQSFSDKENTEFFSSEKNEELKQKIDMHSCLEIPQKYYPDWNADYRWADVGELSVIYFPNEYRLVFYDAGH